MSTAMKINLEETVKLMCQDTLLNKHNHDSDLILSRMKKGLSLDEAFKLPKKYTRITESPMSNRISEMVKDLRLMYIRSEGM